MTRTIRGMLGLFTFSPVINCILRENIIVFGGLRGGQMHIVRGVVLCSVAHVFSPFTDLPRPTRLCFSIFRSYHPSEILPSRVRTS